MNLRIAVILLIASVVAPGLGQAAPKAAKSKYLKTTAAGINISTGEEPLFYSLTLSVRKKLDAPSMSGAFSSGPGRPRSP